MEVNHTEGMDYSYKGILCFSPCISKQSETPIETVQRLSRNPEATVCKLRPSLASLFKNYVQR